jgi:hypothetical protein
MRRLIVGLVLGLLLVLPMGGGYWAYFARQQAPVTLELKGPYQPDQGYCWLVPLQELAKWADSARLSEISNLRVYENGRALGPAHSVHSSIRQVGEGRFAHWGESLFFSTSDNSDPNLNGRKYVITASAPPQQIPLVRDLTYFLLVLALAGGVVGFALMATFNNLLPIRIGLLVVGIINFIIIVTLSANTIPPLAWYGKTAHILMFLMLLVFFTGCFLIFHELQGKGCSDVKQYAFAVLTLWSVLGTFILLVEVFSRTFPVHDTLGLNPGLRFFWPDYVEYPLNAMGYRDRSFSLKKDPQTYRILVVGDSYTEGAGCRRREAFPGVLEAALNQRIKAIGCPLRVEVYNLGICGANTVEEVNLIFKEGPLLKPDLIILAYVLNDPEVHPSDIKLFDPPAWVTAVHKIFLEEVHSYAYYWLFTRFTLFKGNLTPSRDVDKYCLTIHDPQYHGWLEAVAALTDLEKFLKENHYEFLALIYPEFNFQQYPGKMRAVHQQIYQMMQGRGLEVIDLLNFYEGIDKNLSEFAFSAYDAHPNIKAHQLLGQYLAGVVWDRKSFDHFRASCNARGNTSVLPGANRPASQ